MWPFDQKQLRAELENVQLRLDTIHARCKDLETYVQNHEPRSVAELSERQTKLEAKMRDLDSEWSMVYDKYRTLLARLAKRDKAAEDASESTKSNGPRVTNPLAQNILKGGG